MTQPLIAVDIGNTTIKSGVAGSPNAEGLPAWARLVDSETACFDPEQLQGDLPQQPHAWRVASVHRPSERRLASWVRQTRPQDDYRLLSYRDLPITVDVEFPDRVGMDRLVAAVAANRLRGRHRPAIVVDAGTAVTVDAVDTDGVFRGGAILPGFSLTARALAAGTDLLPLVEATFRDVPPPAVGKSTVGAIRSGMFWGGVGAIRELVTRFTEDLGGDPKILVTGREAQLLADFVSRRARFVPELVLAGIAWADA